MRGRCSGATAAFQAASKRSQTLSSAGVRGSVFFSLFALMASLLLPLAADHPELALDGPRHAAQLGGNFLGGVAFHLPRGHRAEVGIAQAVQQAAPPLSHLGRK